MLSKTDVHWLDINLEILNLDVYICKINGGLGAMVSLFWYVPRLPSYMYLVSLLWILFSLHVPLYMAGSYDNEVMSIFALIFTFYLYIKVLDESKFTLYWITLYNGIGFVKVSLEL